MREFFRGWKRKAGCTALFVACLFAAGWVRSFSTADIAESSTSQIHSLNGSLFCEFSPAVFTVKLHFRTKATPGMRHAYSHPSLIRLWHWRAAGFAYGSEEVEIQNAIGAKSHVTIFRFSIPYWSIVIPLTLLSAWLLLSNPQTSKPIPPTIEALQNASNQCMASRGPWNSSVKHKFQCDA